MESAMHISAKIHTYIEKYKANPAWYWLLFTIFSFFVLPEYISPFILFIAFIVFKKQWKREGRLAKTGNLGKLEMLFMGYMLLSTLWSPTKMDTLGCAGLWWAVLLLQIMIYNLARTKERIHKVIGALVASAAVNGAVGIVQIVTCILSANGLLRSSLVLTTPFYRNLDKAVYEALPFEIVTSMWRQRASAFFSNPNLLATFMLVAFPLAVYLIINSKTQKQEKGWMAALVCISAGMASTMTRAGCYIILIAWLVLFIFLSKKYRRPLLHALLPTAVFNMPALFVRYGKIIVFPITYYYIPMDGTEALRSSAMHLKIWKSVMHYIMHHFSAFFIGTGFGMEQTGNILKQHYHLNKPHSHNFIIEIWAELGIIGIFMLAYIIVYAIGKIWEIDLKESRALTLSVCILASFISLLIFGLSDYIFNSPKQIILFMLLLGIIQSLSYAFEKHEINTPADLGYVTKADLKNLIHQ